MIEKTDTKKSNILFVNLTIEQKLTVIDVPVEYLSYADIY